MGRWRVERWGDGEMEGVEGNVLERGRTISGRRRRFGRSYLVRWMECQIPAGIEANCSQGDGETIAAPDVGL